MPNSSISIAVRRWGWESGLVFVAAGLVLFVVATSCTNAHAEALPPVDSEPKRDDAAPAPAIFDCRFHLEDGKLLAEPLDSPGSGLNEVTWTDSELKCPAVESDQIAWVTRLDGLSKEYSSAPPNQEGEDAKLAGRLVLIGASFLCNKLRDGRGPVFPATEALKRAEAVAGRLQPDIRPAITFLLSVAERASSTDAQDVKSRQCSKPAAASAAVAPPAPVPARRPDKSKGKFGPIDDQTWARMQGASWHEGLGCPAREKLSLLEIPYIDFFNEHRVGALIVASAEADNVLGVFSELYKNKFPIASMRLVDEFNGNDLASMAANNTSGFNCRLSTGGGRLSEHAMGTAIDINPIENPFVSRTRVQPVSGKEFADPARRKRGQAGLIRANDVVVQSFAKIGWKWGGNWKSLKDYQHFSKGGR